MIIFEYLIEGFKKNLVLLHTSVFNHVKCTYVQQVQFYNKFVIAS